MKILIELHDWTGIGNVIMMTPAVAALRGMFPDAEIYTSGQPSCAKLISGLGVKYLEKIDSSIQFDYSFIDNVPLELLGEALAAIAKNTKGEIIQLVYDSKNIRHEVHMHMRMPEFLGYKGEIPPPHCDYEEIVPPWGPEERGVVIADTSKPNDNWQKKRWPYFKELAWVLSRLKYRITLVGGGYEAATFDPAGWPEHYNFMGKLSLPQVAGLIKKSAFFVGNDSGPAHMSAALGVKTFVIFGPTSVEKNRPMGKHVVIIASDVSCRPCQFRAIFETCDDIKCMNQITIEDVLDKILKNVSKK